MTDRDALRVQIIAHEGLRLKPYTDTVGKLTIGCGRNLSDVGITYDEAMVLLDHDLDTAINDCASFPWFLALDPVRQRVVVDMRFNLGPTKLRGFARTLKAISDKRYGDAADAMLASKWAKQVGRRAQRLARMMRTGVDDGVAV